MADPLPAPPAAAERDRLLHEAATQFAINIARLDLPTSAVLAAVRAAINQRDAVMHALATNGEH